MTTTALSEFDQLVEQMVERKIPRAKAEAAARRHLGMKSELEELRDQADADALEDEIVEDCDRLVHALGFDVVRLSQKRRSKVTAGVPDRYYVHRRRRLAIWFEGKSASGRQRPAQKIFQEMCDEAGVAYVLGGIQQLRAWLVDHEVATFDESGLPHPIPFSAE